MSFMTFMPLIVAIVPSVLPFLIALASMLYKRALENLPSAQRPLVSSTVNMVVSAVEQAGKDLSGPEKKAEAVRMATSLLEELKLPVSPALLESLIEEAVYLMNQAKPPVASPVGFSVPAQPVSESVAHG